MSSELFGNSRQHAPDDLEQSKSYCNLLKMTFCVGEGEKMCFDHANHKIYKNNTNIHFPLKGEVPLPHYKIFFRKIIFFSYRVVSVNIGVANEPSAFRILYQVVCDAVKCRTVTYKKLRQTAMRRSMGTSYITDRVSRLLS